MSVTKLMTEEAGSKFKKR